MWIPNRTVTERKETADIHVVSIGSNNLNVYDQMCK
jgi:hypothetical protein